eukprot:TRINITY_DN139032_c0_g1_i1.p1 TRINITY_DN139032_c0_g1~~TRINITY_DN139032_c0_g1_i1.p1  ORF type:complete len:481 (+),score=11.08 TRINITY_DN139032_c0_g1_i1:420-1862(+)
MESCQVCSLRKLLLLLLYQLLREDKLPKLPLWKSIFPDQGRQIRSRLLAYFLSLLCIETLRLKCKYEKTGCKEIIEYSNEESHSTNCAYRTFPCTNTGCNEQLLTKDQKAHESVCPFGVVQCKYCEQKTIRSKIKIHEEECDEKTEKCPGCQLVIVKKALNKHMETCGEMLITCPQCEFHDKRAVVEKHSCVVYLKKCQKELNEKLKRMEDMLAFVASAFIKCSICKKVKLESISCDSKCEKCKLQGCDKCMKKCGVCKKGTCIQCEKEDFTCKRCSTSICKTCSKACGDYICANCKSRQIQYHWMDGSRIYIVKPGCTMSTREPLPRFCKITLKLHDDILNCATVWITSNQYNSSSHDWSPNGLNEAVECGWHWCPCGVIPSPLNGPKKANFNTKGLQIKAGDIVEITLSKAGNFEVTHNGTYKGIANTDIGSTIYYLAIGTSRTNYGVEIVSVEELLQSHPFTTLFLFTLLSILLFGC